MVASKAYDVAVIGLGAMGSAVLWNAARRGLKVVGFDQYRPPHGFGSSHGETRITRQAVGEGDAYVPLALRSHALWRSIEAETGAKILRECGFLLIASHDGERAAIHGKDGFLRTTAAAAARHGIAHAMLDAGEIRYRFKQFVGLDGGEVGYFEPGGGMVFPEACIQAQLDIARRERATISYGDRVRRITPGEGCVQVTSDAAAIAAEQVVVCAGSWVAGLIPPELAGLFTVYRQQLNWFRLRTRAAYRPDASPTFIRIHGSSAEDQFYGFPPTAGSLEIKLAEEQYGTPVQGGTPTDPTPHADPSAMFARHVEGRLADVIDQATRSASCVYTMTPDGDFIIDQLPGWERVTIVSACSGHGFKHSAAIGESVAQTLAGSPAPIDLSPFRIGRFDATSSKVRT